MSTPSGWLEDLSDSGIWRLEAICNRFEQSWQAGQRPRLEDFLPSAEGSERLAVLCELLRLDVYYRGRAGEVATAQDYTTRFPDEDAILREVFAVPESGDAPPAPSAESTTDAAERTGPHLGAGNNGERDAHALAGRTDRDPGSASSVPPASRFRMLRFHAAGALGEVFVAEDEELHREVALKEIKRAYAGQGQSRDRFVLEAEITGNLEHPGIVPVYGLGVYPDGRPYYAMRFIQGDTLGAAIKRFHSEAPVRFDSLAFRQLLGRLIAVCQAVGYAHSRGVLHRDIKPGNIMLGKFGETLVVDWGLAKLIGRPEASEAGPNEEGLLRPSAGGRAQATSGVAGTPAYMSPEQAAGKIEELSPATDVYSLGATLYELLTNRPPFKGPVLEVIKQVERGSWVAPRQVNRAVPPALDAICRKAMALLPEDRYGSALALAEDLEHFLGDEPVGAYAEPRGVRLRRWMRKRPRRVTAAAVSLVAAVIGLAGGVVLLERSNRQTRASLAMVEGQANYFMREVSEDLLLNEPGMLPLRQRILLKVLGDYGTFLKNRPGDRYAQQQMAGAKRQLGEVYLHTGRLDEARALEDQAVQEDEELLQKTPKDRELLFGLARARHVLADLQVQSGDSEEGKKEIDRSIQLLERLKAEEPGKVDYMLMLARSYDLRATLAGQQGDTDSGLADNKRVLEVLDEADSRVPGDRTDRGPDQFIRMSHFAARSTSWDNTWQRVLLLGRACTNQGSLLSMSGQNGEAARVLEEAIAVGQMLLEQNSRAGQFRHGMALALLHSGRVKIELGLPVKAEPTLREALERMRQLVQDDPHVKEYRATRLLAAGYLGEALFRQGRTAAAAELLQQAEKQGEEVLGNLRNSRGLRGQHARLLLVLGCLEGESGNLERGLQVCLSSHEKLEQALRETPGDRSLRSDWLASREALARYRFLKGEFTRDRWIAEHQVILKERKDLAGQAPPPRFQGEVARSAVVLAGLLLEAGRPAEALACIDGVLPGHEKVVRTEEDRVKTAAKEQKEAVAIPLKPNQHDSLQLSLRARPIFTDNALQQKWAALLARRGAALARLGRPGKAVEAVQQAVGITENLLWRNLGFDGLPDSLAALGSFLRERLCRPDPGCLYDLGCQLALAATLPRDVGRPDPADRALLALRAAVAFGFDNLHKFRTDPDLEPLRKRADFQKLIRDLEARCARTLPQPH